MKNLIFQVLLSALLLIVIFSCEFMPSGENFRELEKPDTTKLIQFKLSPLETSYVITYPILVTYDLNTFGLKIYNVEFFVGEQSIHKGIDATGAFGFDPAPFGICETKMTMRVTTNTNTGSVSDLSGVEGFIYEKSWNLLLDGGKPNPVEITRVYNDNGALKIEWEPYKRYNFQKYVLYKNFGNIEAEYSKHIVTEITDQNQNFCTDLSYIGGTGIYWVEVQASNQATTGNRKAFVSENPKLDTLWVRSDSAKFAWRKNPFYKAVKETKLTSPPVYYGYPSIELLSSQNGNDTSIVAAGLNFGKAIQYTLTTYPVQNIGITNDY